MILSAICNVGMCSYEGETHPKKTHIQIKHNLHTQFRNWLCKIYPSAPVVYKNSSPLGPEILYTTGAGKGFKVSVAIFASSGGGV